MDALWSAFDVSANGVAVNEWSLVENKKEARQILRLVSKEKRGVNIAWPRLRYINNRVGGWRSKKNFYKNDGWGHTQSNSKQTPYTRSSPKGDWMNTVVHELFHVYTRGKDDEAPVTIILNKKKIDVDAYWFGNTFSR